MSMEISREVVRSPPWNGVVFFLRRLTGVQAAGILDQLLVSGSSFLTTILIGRYAGSLQLGQYALVVSLFASAAAGQNALILLPFSIQQHREHQPPATHTGSAFVLSSCFATLVAGAALLGTVGLALFAAAPALLAIALAVAAASPFVLTREFARRFAFARMEMRTALALDASVSVFQLGALGTLAANRSLTATTACCALGFACAVPALVWYVHASHEMSIERRAIGRTARESWDLGKWLMLGQVTVQVQTYAAYWLIVALGGASVTGVYAACMSIVGFSNPLVFGFANVLTPKLALAWKSGGASGLRREAVRNALLLGALMAAVCVMLALFGNTLLHALFRAAEYEGRGNIVLILGLATLATAVGMPASNALASMERPRAIVVVGGISALVTALLVGLLVVEGGLIGAAYGALAGSIVGAAGRWTAFLAVERGRPSEASAALDLIHAADMESGAGIRRLGEGDYATVYAVTDDPPNPEMRVLKLYKSASNTRMAALQFEALTRLHAVLDGHTYAGWTIRIPRPIRLTYAPLALTMNAVTGEPLEACAIDGASITSAASAIASAMSTAWNAGLMHGDFGLRNMLFDVRQKTIALIDPGPGDACVACEAAGRRLPAHDLGHLVTELVTDVSDVFGHPAARLAKEHFVAAVLQSTRGCDPDELRSSVQAHFDMMLTKGFSARGIWHVLVRAIAERRAAALLAPLPCPDGEGTACSHR